MTRYRSVSGRNHIRDIFQHTLKHHNVPIDLSWDDVFYGFLDREYRQVKELEAQIVAGVPITKAVELFSLTFGGKSFLEVLLKSGYNEEEVTALFLRSLRRTIYQIAVGLITFGRLDVAEDILSNIPLESYGRPPLRQFARSLKNLLPMPEELDPLMDVEEVREWIRVNGSKLRWNDDIGSFE